MNQTIKPLWNHQVEGINRGLRQKDLGLFFEQGTGKSRTMIEVLRRLYAKENRVMRTLILCPIIVCENWKKEFGMYSKINHFDIVVLKGPGRKRVQDFLEIAEKNKIVITNYEAMENKDLHLLLAQWCEILVCDESQRLKNPDSVRAKKVVQIADLCKHRYILTGTPILNSCSDVFMQFRILDGGETFGKNYYAFRHEYFEDANARRKGTQGYFPDWKPKPFTFEVLQDRISHKAMRVLKSECLDLPPFVNQRVDVELGAEQKRMYKQMMNDYVTWLKTKDNEPRAVVAQLAVTKALRLQQIISGFAKDDAGVVHRLEDNPRVKVLEELLTDLTPVHKVIVWATFKENYTMISELCTKLSLGYREIHGDISHKDREKNMQDFRKDPDVRVMIANQSAGGTGINLVEASYSIYFSKNFSLEADLQSAARNYRGGSEIHDKITRIDLVSPGTIDELINEALEKKQNVADNILNWSNQLTKGIK